MKVVKQTKYKSNNSYAHIGQRYNEMTRTFARTLRTEIRNEIDNAILDELFKMMTGVDRL